MNTSSDERTAQAAINLRKDHRSFKFLLPLDQIHVILRKAVELLLELEADQDELSIAS